MVLMTTKVDLKRLPTVLYLPTRRLHAAYAAGTNADGSLGGFYTLCNRRIDHTDRWFEVSRDHLPPHAVHHCKQCQHVIDRDS